MRNEFLERVAAIRAAEQMERVVKEPSYGHQRQGRAGGRPPVLTPAILAMMGDGKPTTAVELSRKLSHPSSKSISRCLFWLSTEGKVKKVGYGVYVRAA